MESLESLLKFTEKFPQVVGNKLQYAFLGGTAIRLHKEEICADFEREISDFDILLFNGKDDYGTHSCSTKDVFGILSGTQDELEKYVQNVKLNGKNYQIMDATFLTLTKTCAIDNPREKDYRDVQFLYDSRLINLRELDSLYKKSERFKEIKKTNPLRILKLLLDNSKIYEKDNGEKIEEKRKKSEKDFELKMRLFQTFPNLIKLLDKFKDDKRAFNLISDYVSNDSSKNGYSLNSVFYNINSFIDSALKNPRNPKISGNSKFSEEEKFYHLSNLLEKARNSNYIKFDRVVHNKLIPRLFSN